jgi:hypothetical protein
MEAEQAALHSKFVLTAMKSSLHRALRLLTGGEIAAVMFTSSAEESEPLPNKILQGE